MWAKSLPLHPEAGESEYLFGYQIRQILGYHILSDRFVVRWDTIAKQDNKISRLYYFNIQNATREMIEPFLREQAEKTLEIFRDSE
jgi:hypothetical protein